MEDRKMDLIYNIAFILVLVGALNWGLVGLIQFDLVAALLAGGGKFGNISAISRIVYVLVGLSALYVATEFFIKMM
jgi:uncharacterized membrane protein YuzA (DUF378 family)